MERRLSLGAWIAVMVVLVAFAATAAVPFLWMISASFKPRAEVERLNFIPESPQPSNYLVVLGRRNPSGWDRPLDISFGRWYFNSIFVAAWVTFLQVLTSALAAYAFSRLQWPGRDKVFLLYLGTMMIPSLVLMIPNFAVLVKAPELLGRWTGIRMRLVNSYAGLILPSAFSTFGTFLLRQFMMTIPPALDEAAKVDGASHWQVFWDVILPQARPGLITLAILVFLANYKSFFWPLVLVKDDCYRTLPIGMLAFQTQYGPQIEYLMAASVMCIVPLIILFVVFQKFIVRGIQLGAVKG